MMDSRTITCPCGNSTTTTGANFGEIRIQTGWTPICEMGGRTAYLCPACFAKVLLLTRQLVKLTGMEMPSLGMILRWGRDDEGAKVVE
ncbi:MAG: hypothetical protein FOGNACKC_00823 [Anaerolineae bacterium]|nr:hypothetical protein [Anaerolineae bacterium]